MNESPQTSVFQIVPLSLQRFSQFMIIHQYKEEVHLSRWVKYTFFFFFKVNRTFVKGELGRSNLNQRHMLRQINIMKKYKCNSRVENLIVLKLFLPRTPRKSSRTPQLGKCTTLKTTTL